jgi:hypothetical protein
VVTLATCFDGTPTEVGMGSGHWQHCQSLPTCLLVTSSFEMSGYWYVQEDELNRAAGVVSWHVFWQHTSLFGRVVVAAIKK